MLWQTKVLSWSNFCDLCEAKVTHIIQRSIEGFLLVCILNYFVQPKSLNVCAFNSWIMNYLVQILEDWNVNNIENMKPNSCFYCTSYLCTVAVFLSLPCKTALEWSYLKPSSRISYRIEILSCHSSHLHHCSTLLIRVVINFQNGTTFCGSSNLP